MIYNIKICKKTSFQAKNKFGHACTKSIPKMILWELFHDWKKNWPLCAYMKNQKFMQVAIWMTKNWQVCAWMKKIKIHGIHLNGVTNTHKWMTNTPKGMES